MEQIYQIPMPKVKMAYLIKSDETGFEFNHYPEWLTKLIDTWEIYQYNQEQVYFEDKPLYVGDCILYAYETDRYMTMPYKDHIPLKIQGFESLYLPIESLKE